MRISTASYCLKQGTVNLFKNRLMSLASVGTISACLLVIGVFYIIVSNVEFMIDSLQNNVGIAVFFEEGQTEAQILAIKTDLEENPAIYKIDYISAQAAWDSFKDKYFEGKEELLAGFETENPLKDSASLQIFLADISQQTALVSRIEATSGVRYVRQDQEVTDIIQSFSDLVKYISVVLIAILIIVSVFLISNTVRLAIELRKTEINIMKYIGATDAIIRGPFLIEGAAIGLFGAVLPLGFIYYFYDNAVGRIQDKFLLLNDFLVFMNIHALFARLMPLSVGIGIGIGVIGSMVTIHRHLKV